MGKVAGAQVNRAVRGDSEPQQFFNVFGYLTDLLRRCPLLSCLGILPGAFYLPSGGVSGASEGGVVLEPSFKFRVDSGAVAAR